jgi:pseudo-rSAM protein
MGKEYWLIIWNYIHSNVKGDHILLYNPYNNNNLILNLNDLENYSKNEISDFKKMTNQLFSLQNHTRIIKFDGDYKQNKSVNSFIKQIKDNFMGDLIDANLSSPPIQPPYKPNIGKDRNNLKKYEFLSLGEGTKKYVKKISLYLNTKSGDSNELISAYRQFNYPYFKKCKKELSFKYISEIYQQFHFSFLERVNILGTDIWKYSNLSKLLELIKTSNIKTEFYLRDTDALENINNFSDFSAKNIKINVLCTKNYTKNHLIMLMDTAKKNNIKMKLNFAISSERDYSNIENIIQELNIKHFTLLPYYNKSNVDFFKENIFVNKEDIFKSNLKLVDIFRNQNLNSNFFGNIHVFHNGDVYANPNNSKLGNLKTHTLMEMIYKEMNQGKSWFKLRKNISPCKSCIFNALCPPISNYEYVFGKYNLCDINT